MTTTIRQLNIDLARALGIRDTDDVMGVDLCIRPGLAPMLTVYRYVKSADGLQTAAEVLNLQAVPAAKGDGA